MKYKENKQGNTTVECCFLFSSFLVLFWDHCLRKSVYILHLTHLSNMLFYFSHGIRVLMRNFLLWNHQCQKRIYSHLQFSSQSQCPLWCSRGPLSPALTCYSQNPFSGELETIASFLKRISPSYLTKIELWNFLLFFWLYQLFFSDLDWAFPQNYAFLITFENYLILEGQSGLLTLAHKVSEEASEIL